MNDVVVSVDETICLCIALAEIVGVSLGGAVGSCDEFEHGEEVGGRVIVLQGIASHTKANESRSGKDRGRMHDETKERNC